LYRLDRPASARPGMGGNRLRHHLPVRYSPKRDEQAAPSQASDGPPWLVWWEEERFPAPGWRFWRCGVSWRVVITTRY